HEALLVSILSTLIPCYRELTDYGDEDFRDSPTAQRVREHMVTLGTKVRVVRPDGSELIGIATGLDHGADLIIDDRVSVRDRKSTRLNSSHVSNLVCRLL